MSTSSIVGSGAYPPVRVMPAFAIKAFDKAAKATGLFQGNAVTDCQRSFFVRCVNDTECNGFAFPAGKLRISDLSQFGKSTTIPARVLDAVMTETRTQKIVLSRFGYWARAVGTTNPQFRLVGWVIVTPDGKILHQFPVPEGKKAETFAQALAYLKYH